MKSIFLKNNESEINKKSVIKNKDTTDYILINKLFKLMINSDYSNFTKHLLYNSPDVLKNIHFYELYENHDSETGKTELEDENSYNTNISLVKLSIYLQDPYFQSVIFPNISIEEFNISNIKNRELRAMEVLDHIIFRDDRNSFINLLENIKTTPELSIDNLIISTFYRISLNYLRGCERSEHSEKNQESFFNWLIDLNFSKECIYNNTNLFVDKEKLLIMKDKYIIPISNHFNKQQFNKLFLEEFKEYIEHERYHHTSYYGRENSHTLLPALMKNNNLKELDSLSMQYVKTQFSKSALKNNRKMNQTDIEELWNLNTKESENKSKNIIKKKKI